MAAVVVVRAWREACFWNTHKSSQDLLYSPNDTQTKYTEQSATIVPLRSTDTQGAPCRKQQAGRE